MTASPLASSDEEPTWLVTKVSFPSAAASLPVKELAPLSTIVPLPVLVMPPAPLIAPEYVKPVLELIWKVLSAVIVTGLWMLTALVWLASVRVAPWATIARETVPVGRKNCPVVPAL